MIAIDADDRGKILFPFDKRECITLKQTCRN